MNKTEKQAALVAYIGYGLIFLMVVAFISGVETDPSPEIPFNEYCENRGGAIIKDFNGKYICISVMAREENK